MVIGSVQEMINKVSSNLYGDSEKEAKSKIHLLKSFAARKEETSLSLYVTVAEIACLFGCPAEDYYKNFGFKVDDLMDLPYDRIWANVDLTWWYISLPWSKLVRMDEPVEKVLEHVPEEKDEEVLKQEPDECYLETSTDKLSDSDASHNGYNLGYRFELITTNRDVYLDILEYASTPRVFKLDPDEYHLEASSDKLSDSNASNNRFKRGYRFELITSDRDVYLDILEYASKRMCEAQKEENTTTRL